MDCLFCRSSHTTTDDESEVHAFLLVNEENSENEENGFENELDINDNKSGNGNRECNSNPEYSNSSVIRKKSYSRNVVKRNDKNNRRSKEYDFVEVDDERRRKDRVLFPMHF